MASFLKSTWANRLVSMALLALAVAAGIKIWPYFGPPSGAVALVPAFERAPALQASSPAFILDESFFSHQCGRLFVADGPLLAPYADGGCRERARTATLVVYDADIRLLWSLLTDAERGEILAMVRDTADQLRHSVQASLAEDFFDKEYRPLIRDILRDSLQRTLERPAVRDAIERATGSLDPAAMEAVVAGIVPVVVERIEGGLWDSLRAMAGNLLGGGGEAKSLASILSGALNDPRVRQNLRTSLPRLADSPGAADAATVIATEFCVVLLEDPRVPQLFQHLLTDRRLGAVAALGRDSAPHELPRKLLKLRSRRDHNPLSAYVVRLAIHGRSGQVLLMLTPRQYETLSASAGRGIVLIPAKPS